MSCDDLTLILEEKTPCTTDSLEYVTSEGEELGRTGDTELELCKVLGKGVGLLSSWKLAIPVPLINLILLLQGRLFFHTGRNECPISVYYGTPFICLSFTMCFLLCFPLLIISAFGLFFFSCPSR